MQPLQKIKKKGFTRHTLPLTEITHAHLLPLPNAATNVLQPLIHAQPHALHTHGSLSLGGGGTKDLELLQINS